MPGFNGCACWGVLQIAQQKDLNAAIEKAALFFPTMPEGVVGTIYADPTKVVFSEDGNTVVSITES